MTYSDQYFDKTGSYEVVYEITELTNSNLRIGFALSTEPMGDVNASNWAVSIIYVDTANSGKAIFRGTTAGIVRDEVLSGGTFSQGDIVKISWNAGPVLVNKTCSATYR